VAEVVHELMTAVVAVDAVRVGVGSSGVPRPAPSLRGVELGDHLVERRGQLAGAGPAAGALLAAVGLDAVEVQHAKRDFVAGGGHGVHRRAEPA
jgi:hypothetical protein